MGRDLSEREKQLLARLDKRVPIKLIAADLGVFHTRINQHIRALKTLWGVNGLSERAGSGAAQQPNLAPEALDGRHALVLRLATMIAMALGIPAGAVLTIEMARSVGEVVDHFTHIPEEV